MARSDRLELRVTTEERFSLQGAGDESLGLGPLPGQEPPASAAAMTRLLDMPSGSVQILLERLRNVLTAVNAAPPLGRGAVRRDAAETLLALGMPQEAQAMATLAFRESPEAREDPRLVLAHGVAALLSGRLEDARAIDDPRLPPRDEVVLWRALLATTRGQDAVARLRASAPVLLTYPEALRRRSLPMAAEALAGGGEAAGAAALLARAGEMPGLELARAMVMEAQGEQGAAIAAYGALVEGRDRRHRAIAMRRLAELRLAAGSIDRPAAAEALEQSLYAWRGGEEEIALRRRIAELRQAAGQGEQAFALIDETGRLFPEHSSALRPALQNAFASALETAPPLTAATLFDTHPDLLPAGERGEAAILVLAERLAGLDLPQRAAALLQRAMAATSEGAARAAIGARLAAMRAAEGDHAGAIAALDASESDNPDAALARRRTVLRARAMARGGARMEATALLATLGPDGAIAMAELRAEARDWAGAAAATAEHLAASLPAASEPLGQEHRAALARQAAYLALAGDDAGLAALRASQGARMAGGPLAEAFGVLTSDPVRGLSDLPRLQRELGMMRLVPSRLEALRAGVQVAR
jgi:predicted negative regulator of RcsB-dependent stress response